MFQKETLVLDSLNLKNLGDRLCSVEEYKEAFRSYAKAIVSSVLLTLLLFCKQLFNYFLAFSGKEPRYGVLQSARRLLH
jgi:hypothetical protein